MQTRIDHTDTQSVVQLPSVPTGTLSPEESPCQDDASQEPPRRSDASLEPPRHFDRPARYPTRERRPPSYLSDFDT